MLIFGTCVVRYLCYAVKDLAGCRTEQPFRNLGPFAFKLIRQHLRGEGIRLIKDRDGFSSEPGRAFEREVL
jgi:hypothetical protein